MNLLCAELARKRDYSEQYNSLTSNLLFVDLCICVGEYFSGTKRKKLITYLCISHIVICVFTCLFFLFFLSDHENIAMSTE